MRVRVCLLAIVAMSGAACFKELPPVPGDSAETSSESTAAVTTTETPTTSSSSSEANTVAGTTDEIDSDTDVDPTTSTMPDPPEDMGLFKCEPKACEPWDRPDCKTGCGALDEAGACLFELMRVRGVGRGDVRHCEAEACERTAVALRGGGTDEVLRQAAVELDGGGLGEYKDLKVCHLREPEFFAACLVELTPACADVTAWFTGCEALETACPDG